MTQIDFSAILSGKIKFADAIRDIPYTDLRMVTADVFSTIEAIIAQATDDDVTFVPNDPQASEGEQGWTLSHIIAHLTSSLEAAAAGAAMLARGVTLKESLRYEVPWESITTVQQLRSRLSESHRMCNAFLDAWPDEPHLDITVTPFPSLGPLNATGNYMLGVGHAFMHFDQLRETIRQAKEA